MAWQEHRQQSKTKVDLAETAKTTNEPTAQGSDSTLDIEATYNKAIERSEQSQHMEAESQMRNSAVEYIHPFTPNNI